MERNKAVPMILGIFGTLAAVLLLRKKPEGVRASLSTRILDSLGNEVPHNSAAELQPGGSYQIEATVTNLSTSSGQPVAATLRTLAKVFAGWQLGSFSTQGVYDAQQSKIHSFGFSVPLEAAGFSGAIDVSVLDPNGNELAKASLPFYVKEA